MEISDFDAVNPGDQLVVKCDLQAGQVYNAQTVMPEMVGLASCIVTVGNIEKASSSRRGYNIQIVEDKFGWYWSPGMFESIYSAGSVSLSDYLY